MKQNYQEHLQYYNTLQHCDIIIEQKLVVVQNLISLGTKSNMSQEQVQLANDYIAELMQCKQIELVLTEQLQNTESIDAKQLSKFQVQLDKLVNKIDELRIIAVDGYVRSIQPPSGTSNADGNVSEFLHKKDD